jgi:hypothetical protein
MMMMISFFPLKLLRRWRCFADARNMEFSFSINTVFFSPKPKTIFCIFDSFYSIHFTSFQTSILMFFRYFIISSHAAVSPFSYIAFSGICLSRQSPDEFHAGV